MAGGNRGAEQAQQLQHPMLAINATGKVISKPNSAGTGTSAGTMSHAP